MIFTGSIPENYLTGIKTIVFTNGCFDLLHPGHIHLLQFAKKQGDFLVVGLNSDASVSRLKGKDRPVQNIDKRLKALNGLPEVDAIIVFEEDTPIRLLETIRPQVYVKGADYSAELFPEAEFVSAYGGRVLYAPILEGYSTSHILAKAKQKE